jgi:hypothetical protein
MFGNVVFVRKHHSTKEQLTSMKENASIILRPEAVQPVFGLVL